MMMSVIFMLSSSIIFVWNWNVLTFLLNMVILNIFFKLSYISSMKEYGSMFFNDLTSMILILLSVFVTILSIITSVKTFYPTKMIYFFLGLLLFLILAFSVKSIISFYFWFECTLMPIFFIILGWGYQPERLRAGKFMVMYTVLSSLPLLIFIVMLKETFHVKYFNDLELISRSCTPAIANTIACLTLLSFLVKFPMYMFHLWLPKAHVEAPVGGSMMLAGVLLKLGGYGMLRFQYLTQEITWAKNFIIMLSLMGGAFVSVVCLTQNDLKVLIAYSSVSHMSLAITSVLLNTSFLKSSTLMILLTHGTTSSAMFLSANFLYSRSLSRNMVQNSSFLLLIPNFVMFWALFNISNMAGPPSSNMFVELHTYLGILSMAFWAWMPLGMMAIATLAYTINLFSSTSHGKVLNSKTHYPSLKVMDQLTMMILLLSIFGITPALLSFATFA